jgi:asparagine N-glycosylation enzyme membrane subunit Stt3
MAVAAEDYEPLKARDGVLMTLIVILVVMWLLGMVTTYTLGGFLHVLLVIAVILLLVRMIQGRPI